MHQRLKLRRNERTNFRRWLYTAGTASAISFCFVGGPLWGQAVQPVIRSLDDVRGRVVDELDKPRYRNRQSHLGWEIRNDQLIVNTNTSEEDAEWVAEQVDATWTRMGGLADNWTNVHRHGDFAIGTFTVYVDQNPLRERDAPLATMRVVSAQTMVYLNVSPGQPSLEEQLPILQQATALGFLHVSELDRKLPRWVLEGLAAYAAGSAVAPELPEGAAPITLPLAGRNNQGLVRVAPDRLEMPEDDTEDAAMWIRFLLEGDDARFAPTFMQAMRDTIANGSDEQMERRAPTREHRDAILYGSGDPTELDDLTEEPALVREIELWQRDPQIDQPLLPTVNGAPVELTPTQQEMLLVLKLARRFQTQPKPTVRFKVVGENADQLQYLNNPPVVDRPIDLQSWFDKWTDPSREPWATLDVDGSLLLSNNEERLEELSEQATHDFRAVWRDGRVVLIYVGDEKNFMEAWLEENPQNPRRPIARFQLVPRGGQTYRD